VSSEEKDISALKKEISGLRETLKQVGYQNQMMLNWVNGAVITVDREGRVNHANEAALLALGWSIEAFIGLHVHETIHHSQDDGSEYPWEFCPVFAAIEDGSSHHVDGDVFWHRNGSSFSADYIVCPARDENNEITGAVLTFRNLTEQKIQEAKRIHSMKLESIGELSAGIAHEINTPIQFIGNNISFLQDSFDDMLKLLESYAELREAVAGRAEYSKIINKIDLAAEEADIEYLQEEGPKAFEQTQHGVDRVTKLVLGLKGFARSGEGDKKGSADINEIIRNTLNVCQNAYKYVADLELDLEELPSISVFAGDIGQVLVNLVVNAAHAIEEKRNSSDPLGKIHISSRKDEHDIFISVSDTGGGIPEGLKERVFDPFFTTKEVGRGSGQGLAISRTIIHDRHNGELSFESTVGKGTTFIIRLPYTEDSE
jgi:PAS domain S-box-containing protein